VKLPPTIPQTLTQKRHHIDVLRAENKSLPSGQGIYFVGGGKNPEPSSSDTPSTDRIIDARPFTPEFYNDTRMRMSPEVQKNLGLVKVPSNQQNPPRHSWSSHQASNRSSASSELEMPTFSWRKSDSNKVRQARINELLDYYQQMVSSIKISVPHQELVKKHVEVEQAHSNASDDDRRAYVRSELTAFLNVPPHQLAPHQLDRLFSPRSPHRISAHSSVSQPECETLTYDNKMPTYNWKDSDPKSVKNKHRRNVRQYYTEMAFSGPTLDNLINEHIRIEEAYSAQHPRATPHNRRQHVLKEMNKFLNTLPDSSSATTSETT